MRAKKTMRSLAIVSLATALVGAAFTPVTAAGGAPSDARVPVLLHEGGAWTIHDGDAVIPLPESITDNSGDVLSGPGEFDLLSADSTTHYVVSEFTRERDEDGHMETDGRTRFELHRIASDGSVTTFHDVRGEADDAWAYPSYNGSRVFVSTPVDDWPDARVVMLDGTVIPLPDKFGAERVLDFVGPKLLHAKYVRTKRFTGEKLVLRNLNRKTAKVRFRAANEGITAASISPGVVAWRKPRAGKKKPIRTSFAKLNKPKKVLWTKKFDALALNLRATRIIGWGPKGRLQIRRTSDGKVLGKLPASLRVEDVFWENKNVVLIVGGGTITACSAAGNCVERLQVEGQVDLAEVLVSY